MSNPIGDSSSDALRILVEQEKRALHDGRRSVAEILSKLDPGLVSDTYFGDSSDLSIAKMLSTTASPMLTGSTDQLEGRVTKIEGLLQGVSASLSAQTQPDIQPFVNEVRIRFDAMAKEVSEIKSSEVPVIKQANDLIREVGPFLTSAMAAQGKLEGLNGRVDSIEIRVKDLETRRHESWNRTYAWITAALTLVGIVAGFLASYMFRQ